MLVLCWLPACPSNGSQRRSMPAFPFLMPGTTRRCCNYDLPMLGCSATSPDLNAASLNCLARDWSGLDYACTDSWVTSGKHQASKTIRRSYAEVRRTLHELPLHDATACYTISWLLVGQCDLKSFGTRPDFSDQQHIC